MRTKLLVFAVLATALFLSACNFPVFSNPAPVMQHHTIEASGFQGETVCEPNPGETCAVVSTKTISGGQTTSTYMVAEWVGPNMPSSIEVKFNLRGLENQSIEVVPGVQKILDGGIYDDDVTVYGIEVKGFTCDWRTNTKVIDCSKN
jgi:hypothetical protein